MWIICWYTCLSLRTSLGPISTTSVCWRSSKWKEHRVHRDNSMLMVTWSPRTVFNGGHRETPKFFSAKESNVLPKSTDLYPKSKGSARFLLGFIMFQYSILASTSSVQFMSYFWIRTIYSDFFLLGSIQTAIVLLVTTIRHYHKTGEVKQFWRLDMSNQKTMDPIGGSEGYSISSFGVIPVTLAGFLCQLDTS